MISTLTEHIPISEIAASRGVTPGAVYRWIRVGVRVGGVVVRLKSVRCGGSVRVRLDDLEEFDRLCNPEPWRQAALQQERERRDARRDRKKLKDRLGPK